MKKKREAFIEEYSTNFSVLFVEMFIVRYGEINNYDKFLSDYKNCINLTKTKAASLFSKRVTDMYRASKNGE